MDEFCEENRARSGVGAFITCAQNDGPSGAAGAVLEILRLAGGLPAGAYPNLAICRMFPVGKKATECLFALNAYGVRALPGDRRQAGPLRAGLDPRSEARRVPDAGHPRERARAAVLAQRHRLDPALSVDCRGRAEEPAEAFRR